MSEVLEVARRARTAAAGLAPLPRRSRTRRCTPWPTRCWRGPPRCSRPTRLTSRPAARPGTAESLLDRLALTEARVAAMADGLRHVAGLPDPVGRGGPRLDAAQRPGAAAGPRAARRRRDRVRGPPQRHRRRGRAVRQERQRRAAARQRQRRTAPTRCSCACSPRRPPPPGLPEHSVQLVPGTDRASVQELMRARGLVDVLIPRGGAGPHRGRRDRLAGARSSRPASATAPSTSTRRPTSTWRSSIVVDAKTTRPSVCNAAETLLVHEAVAAEFLPRVEKALEGVVLHADARAAEHLSASRCSRATRTGRRSTCRSTSPSASSTRSRRRPTTSGGGGAATPRRSSPARSRRPAASSAGSTAPR